MAIRETGSQLTSLFFIVKYLPGGNDTGRSFPYSSTSIILNVNATDEVQEYIDR